MSKITYAQGLDMTATDQKAIDVAVSFLEDSTYSQYNAEPRQMEKHTINSVEDNQLTTLSQISTGLGSFRASQSDCFFTDTKLATGELSAVKDNLALQQARISYFANLHRQENISYSFFTPTYIVAGCTVSGDLAVVDLYESLDFQYSNCDEPSFVLTQYRVTLFRIDDVWLAAAVESDDDFSLTNRESGFDLQSELAGVNASYEAEHSVSVSNLAEDNQKPGAVVLALAATDKPYRPQNAINYAMTYSTSTDSGNIPSYKNTYFLWDDASCQLFASQCVWAGFAGSNSQADINNKQAMDASGSYNWWCTKTGDINWLYTIGFKSYIDAVKNSATENGVVCDTYAVAYNSNNMGFSANDLKGAVIQTKGSAGALRHAVFVNNATGTTRSAVYITAYNNCRKNVLLSTSYPSSTTDTLAGLYVMVPRYFRGAPTNYLYGDLQNAYQAGTSGVTLTLYGRAVSSVFSLNLKVFAPGAATAAATFTASNAITVSGSYKFTTAGTWRVEVSGTGLSTFTYTIRIG